MTGTISKGASKGAPFRLVSWLISEGGCQDQSGEISHVIGRPKDRPGLISHKGMTLDDAALKAWEAGFFPGLSSRPSIDDLLEAIGQDVRGAPRYSIHDEAIVAAKRARRDAGAEFDRLAAHGQRVALYARVSTDRGEQDPENQLAPMRDWARATGQDVVVEYVDFASGGKGEDKRPQFARMMDDAHRRRFDVVCCWAIDRLSREGMAAVVGYLQRLDAAGVSFHSFTEPALCSDNELVRDVVLAIMAALARAERQRISERVKAGLARVRVHGSKSGRPIGRPGLDVKVLKRIRALAADGASNYAIAKTLKLDPHTVAKYRSGGEP
jgi:DNA invertase Pin-like site-specific DNA recombinase